MLPHQNPKYRAPKSHFQRRPPPTPTLAYSAPLQWTPPSSPVTRSMPLPSLPPYSTPELECPASRSFPSGEPLSQPIPLPLFRANHPSPQQPATSPLFRNPRPVRFPVPQWGNFPCNHPPRRHLYLRHETLLLVVCLVLQLAALVILGTALTHNDSRLCGGRLRPSRLST